MRDDSIFGTPEFDPEECFVSSKATVIGKVIIEKDVMVAPGACLRADEGAPFKICKGTNIQDGVFVHGLLEKYVKGDDGEKYSVYIGSHCSIAHGALIHGPTKIGKKTFVGFKATVHNSTVGRNCYIGIGAIVNGVHIADNRFIHDGAVINCQEVADGLPLVPDDKKHFNKDVVDYNKGVLCRRYQLRRQTHEHLSS